MSAHRHRRRAVLAIVTLVSASALTTGAACVVGGLTFEDRSPTPNGQNDAKAPGDGSILTPSDGAGSPDSPTSKPTDASNDVDTGVPVTPCSEDTILTGVKVVTGAVNTDDVVTGEVNAFPSTPPAAAAARCARINLAVVPVGGAAVRVGVYSEQGGLPNTRIAMANIAAPIVGWNPVVLDTAVALSPGVRVWLAVVPQSGDARITVRTDCQARRIHNSANGMLPSTFSPSGVQNYCDAAFYLSP